MRRIAIRRKQRGEKQVTRFQHSIRVTGIALSLLAGACAASPELIPQASRHSLYDPFKDETVEEKKGETHDASASETGGDAPAADKLIYYRGRPGALERLNGTRDDRLEGRMLQLNFVDAPASDATRTVIRDALGDTVLVADGVSGVITLAAPEPVPARDALDALERALAESNLALIETDAGFLLTTLQDAAQTPQAPGGRAIVGYSTTIAPVSHAVASDIVRLVEPFLTGRLTLTPDDAQSAIIVRGPTVDVETALDAIATFDAPYLTDRVVGLFKLEFADAQTVGNEVETLMAASGVGLNDASAIIALPRLNLLFVSTRTREAFAETRGWIERFDQPSGGDQRRLRYYPVQYTPAEELAAQLNTAFGGGFVSANVSGVSAFAGAGRQGETPARQAPPPSFAAANLGGPRGGGASITPDTLNNALLIRATDQEYAEILDLIERMDVQAAQVLIEATIAEVTLTDDLSFGVRWFFENAESDLEFSSAGNLNPVFPGLNYSFIDGNVGFALNTLASITEVNVLSAPSIVVLNNQSANLQVGDEVPILTQQAQSVVDPDAPIVSTVQLRETGVILEVSPRINASDVVVMEISQEVSDVAATEVSNIDTPTIQQRRFTSTVSVKDKNTILLGGLIRETFTENASGVPVLMDIPVLGNAFKSRSFNKRRTELLVFLTPHIIRNESDGRAAFRQLRRKLQGLYNDPPRNDLQAPVN